jgi:hypothetical protein
MGNEFEPFKVLIPSGAGQVPESYRLPGSQLGNCRVFGTFSKLPDTVFLRFFFSEFQLQSSLLMKSLKNPVFRGGILAANFLFHFLVPIFVLEF